MTAITISLRVTAPGPAVARVSVGRRQFSIGRPVEFDDASPHVAALEFAVSLINEVVAGIDHLRLGLHICRGNWSRDETTLLSGSYQALRPYLDRLQVTQLVLEYATDRAGTLVAFEGKELGLGVVNPRTEQVETPAQIRSAVEEALGLYPAERVFLNPDCGFGTFSSRPMNTREMASAKVAAMVAAARDLRGRSWT